MRRVLTIAAIAIIVLLNSLASAQIASTQQLPQDQTLEVVTWNLEWFGSTSYGPADENLQLQNVVKVLDSLKADIYALQEVSDQQSVDQIVSHLSLPSYHGFVADYITYNQKMAFIYNTETVDSLTSGAITESMNDYYWASRLPFQFTFKVHINGETANIMAVDIHAKANTGDQSLSYRRRIEAAESIYQYFQNNRPDTRIIMLGDYNDDMDVSIFNDQPTPYQLFLDDTQHYKVVTKALTDDGKSSNVYYDNMIDHITISNELFNRYIDGSEAVFMADDWIASYSSTTSDHRPVWTRFDFSSATPIHTDENELPRQTILKPNYPNPFNPSTSLTFELAEPKQVSLQIINIQGTTVSSPLYHQHMPAGVHHIRFNAIDLPSGIYFYRLTTRQGESFTRKMLLLK